MTTVKTNSTNRLIPDKFARFPQVRYEHFLGGISGGVTSTLLLHPFDLLKIRFAVNDGRATHIPQYMTLRHAYKIIVKEEGIRGLYRGVTANVWGSGTAWGLYFLYYNTLKLWLQGGDSRQSLGYMLNMIVAAQAGVFTLCCTNPIWVIKTRLCLQTHATNTNNLDGYKGIVDAFNKIYRKEGVRGFYKGFVPGLFGVSHGSIQFMAYEEMKDKYNKHLNRPINEKLPTACYLAFAAISKLIAAAITYPYQVVRARLQDNNHSYKGTVDCVQKIFRFEGVFGFYKGLSPNLARVVPATMITFVVYENVTHFVAALKK